MKELLAQVIEWLNNLLNKLKGVERKMTEKKQNNSSINSQKDKSDNEINEQQKVTKKSDKITKSGKDEIEEASQEVAAVTVDELKDINRVKLEKDLDNNIKKISSEINDLVNKVDKISNKEKVINVNNNFGKLEEDIVYIFEKVEKIHEENSKVKKKIGKLDDASEKIRGNITDNSNKINSRIRNLMKKLVDINKDINNNNLKEKINQIERNINNKLDNIKVPNKRINEIHNKTRNMDSKFKKLNDELNNLEKLIEELSFKDEVKIELKPISEKIESTKKVVVEQLEEIMLEKLTPQANDLDEIKKTVEILEGKFNILDDIKETLADEGVSIEQELAPVNEEDEVIKELADYGKEIFDYLTTAARHYAQKREDINNLDKIRKNHHQEVKKTKEKFYQKGKQDAKNEIIEDLLDGFNDLDQLFNGEDGINRTLVSFLKNNGLERDEKLSQGKIIEITDQERTEFEARASFKGSGKFKVKKSCFRLGDVIIDKADLEELKEEPKGDDNPKEDDPLDKTNESNENKSGTQGKVNNSYEADQEVDREVSPDNKQNE